MWDIKRELRQVFDLAGAEDAWPSRSNNALWLAQNKHFNQMWGLSGQCLRDYPARVMFV